MSQVMVDYVDEQVRTALTEVCNLIEAAGPNPSLGDRLVIEAAMNDADRSLRIAHALREQSKE